MTSLPVDIVNYICKLASHGKKWYPFFCPKTNKLTWKVNKSNKEYINNAETLFHMKYNVYHNAIISVKPFYQSPDFELYNGTFACLVVNEKDYVFAQFYDNDDGAKYTAFMRLNGRIRTHTVMLCGLFEAHNLPYLYRNSTIYSEIDSCDAWIGNIIGNNKRLNMNLNRI